MKLNDFKRHTLQRSESMPGELYFLKLVASKDTCAVAVHVFLPSSKELTASDVSVDDVVDIVLKGISTDCAPNTVHKHFQSALVL